MDETSLHEQGRQKEAHCRTEVDESRGWAAVSPEIVGHPCVKRNKLLLVEEYNIYIKSSENYLKPTGIRIGGVE